MGLVFSWLQQREDDKLGRGRQHARLLEGDCTTCSADETRAAKKESSNDTTSESSYRRDLLMVKAVGVAAKEL
jgi:hypothetical protein